MMNINLVLKALGYLLTTTAPIIAHAVGLWLGSGPGDALGLFLGSLGGYILHKQEPPGRKALPLAVWLVIGISLGLALSACPKPTPGPTPKPGIVECGTEAIQKCAATALPGVNECLSGKGDVVTCILGLIQPAGCITYDVVACLTRHEGSDAEHAAQVNPDDRRDARRAARAKEFLEKTGAHFQ